MSRCLLFKYLLTRCLFFKYLLSMYLFLHLFSRYLLVIMDVAEVSMY
jgi:hypothetical protein